MYGSVWLGVWWCVCAGYGRGVTAVGSVCGAVCGRGMIVYGSVCCGVCGSGMIVCGRCLADWVGVVLAVG